MPNRPIELLWEHRGIRCVLFEAPYGVELVLTQHQAVVQSVELATADIAVALAARWFAALDSILTPTPPEA